jgi:hypothetical protein
VGGLLAGNDRLVAAFCVNAPPDLLQARRLIQAGADVDAGLADPAVPVGRPSAAERPAAGYGPGSGGLAGPDAAWRVFGASRCGKV